MLVQDTLTGYIHEVPDSQLYETNYGESPEQMAEGQMVYDGLGNPVGFLKSLKRFARKAVSRLAPIASQLAPFVPIPGAAALTQVARRALPSLVQRLAPTAQRLVRGLPAAVAQQFAPVAQALQPPPPAAVPTTPPPPPPEAAPAESVVGYYGDEYGYVPGGFGAYGNPVGLPFLAPLISAAAPAVISALARRRTPTPPPLPPMAPPPPMPAPEPAPPMAMQMPAPFPAPMPFTQPPPPSQFPMPFPPMPGGQPPVVSMPFAPFSSPFARFRRRRR